MDALIRDALREMTVEQLEEGLTRANEQLRMYLSRTSLGSRGASPILSRDTGVALQSVQKLQNTVRSIETEIRSRDGGPDGLTARFEMKMSPEQKQWVMDNGGAAKVRELIDRARQR